MIENHEMYGDVRAAIIHNSAVDYSLGRLLVIDYDGVVRELYDDGYRKQSEGEWKPWGEMFYCSLCTKNERYKSPFCPNCGAKMKGE